MRLRHVIVLAVIGLAACAADSGVEPQNHCLVPDGLLDRTRPLPRTHARITAGDPLKIVAIGSSSTAGAGASAPSRSYPARLEAELRARFPGQRITVINKGVNGETVRGMLARLDDDVLSLFPDLVIWQTGTNSALRNSSPARFRVELVNGVRELKRADIDVVLMGPQYAPRFNRRPNRMEFVDAVAGVAAAENVVLFPRHAIMKYWWDSKRFDFDVMLSKDGLHLNDLSYNCIAELLAEQIERSVNR